MPRAALITGEIKNKGPSVMSFLLSRNSSFQVSGMIRVDVQTAMGARTYYSACLATMNPDSGKSDWHCDSVP